MSTFSIPADFKPSTIDQIAQKNKAWDIPVKEVYGSLNPSIVGSGRHGAVIHPMKMGTLKKYVDNVHKNELEFNYALNFSCASNMEFTPKGQKKIIKFVRKLRSIGIKRFTIVLPSIIELIDKFVPDTNISVSVISTVDSVGKVKAFMATKSVDKIILPEFMNRKIAQLEKISSYKKEAGFKLGTIVNSTCLIDCPFRNFHYAFASHTASGKKYKPIDYWSTRCTLMKLKNPVEVLKMGWIRPEDITKYSKMGIDSFKIAGREMKNTDFSKIVDIYNKGDYDGNLWELLRCFSDSCAPPSELVYGRMFDIQNKKLDDFTKNFFETKTLCKARNCENCRYCLNNADLVQVNQANEWKRKLQAEYQSYFNNFK